LRLAFSRRDAGLELDMGTASTSTFFRFSAGSAIKTLFGAALLACVAVMTSFPAHAGGSVGFSYWSGPGYYPYHHHPRPYWGPRYRSSIVVYQPYYPPPRPIYYPAYPVYPAPVVQATQQCTHYNGDAIVDGSGQPFYGRACLFTDGRWHIMP
jgi:hypothetical protein